MPELPEAETIKRGLAALALGKVIKRVEVTRPNTVGGQGVTDFCRLVEGRKVASVRRRGKAVILDLSAGISIIFRLGMTGRLICQGGEEKASPHDRVIFHWEDGGGLVFQDPRGFGRARALPKNLVEEEENLGRLGIEPLAAEFTWQELRRVLGKTKTPLKAALLDQTRVAGIGNIYANEILFCSGIHPARLPQSLNTKEWRRLAEATQEVLMEATEAEGSSISDYLKPDGGPGSYQNRMKAYGREGRPCSRCGEAIVKMKLGGRSTFFCPRCQAGTARTRDKGQKATSGRAVPQQ